MTINTQMKKNMNGKWQHWILVSFPIQFCVRRRYVLYDVSTGALPWVWKCKDIPQCGLCIFVWAIMKYQTQFAFISKVLKLIMIHNWSIQAIDLKTTYWSDVEIHNLMLHMHKHQGAYIVQCDKFVRVCCVRVNKVYYIIVWFDVLDRVGNVMWPFISGITP